MARYTMTQQQAEAELRSLVERQIAPERFRVWVGDDRMGIECPASYRLTVRSGLANAYKSSRSDRWRVEYR